MNGFRGLMPAALVFALLTCQATAEPTAPAIVGDWQGTLEAGGAKLRLVVHLTRGTDGLLAATLDSLDQQAFALPVAKASFEDGALRLELPNLGARYEGTLDPAGNEFAGTWTQGPNSFSLTLTRQTAKERSDAETKPSASDPIKPTWFGTLDAGIQKLRTGLHFSRDKDGILTATMDSIDQGAHGIPVSRAVYKDRRLLLELPALAAQYEATMNEAGTELTGTFTQRGTALPLSMKAVDEVPKQNRPQEPKGALPYVSEEVAYRNEAGGVKLAGTLTLPNSGGPFRAVVLITGSGAEDGDETVFGHKPFLVLADHLTRAGIAVLRVDDRGVGGSDPGPEGATSEDFAGDALAGVAYLRTRKEIDAQKIGLVGHSEGGLIAPAAAVRSDDVKFIVLMAGPGLRGDQLLMLQTAALLRAIGKSEAEVAEACDINAKVYRAVMEEADPVPREKRVREALASSGLPADGIEAQVKMVLAPWMRYFLSYDPRPTLSKVKVPVLAINGERDRQVPAKENIDAIRAALDAAGHKEHQLVTLPRLNHLFQECETGSPAEYSQIEQTMSPDALALVSSWILAR